WRRPPTKAPLSTPPVSRCRQRARACRRVQGRSATARAPACAACASAAAAVEPRAGPSIYVLLIAADLFQIGDESNGLIARARAVRGDDLDPGALHILGHALGVAADVDVGAFGEPRPELAAELAHAILDVELLTAVARPRQREPRQRAGSFHAAKLVFVEEVVVAALVAEEQPIATGRFARHAFVEKRAERRDAGAGPDHDDGRRRVRRKTEVLRLLDVDLDLVAGARPLAEEGGGNAEPLAP